MENKERIAYIFLLLVLIAILLCTCATKTAIEENAIMQQQQYKKRILADSSTIYSQSVNIKTKDIEISELKKMAVKSPEVVIQTKTKTVIKTEIKLDTIMVEGTPMIKLPKSFYRKEKWFTIGGVINRLGVLQIDSLVTHVKMTYAIGDTLRSGPINKLFNKRDKVVRLLVDNPSINITGMSNIVIKEKKRWYETTAFKFGLGVVVGAGVIRATN
jgi:uncharacterized protein YcfL